MMITGYANLALPSQDASHAKAQPLANIAHLGSTLMGLFVVAAC